MLHTQQCLNGDILFIGQSINQKITPLLDKSGYNIVTYKDILNTCSTIDFQLECNSNGTTRSWFAATLVNIYDRLLPLNTEDVITEFNAGGIELTFNQVNRCFMPALESSNDKSSLAFSYFKRKI